MISAAEARELANNISKLQLEQIERGIKETILAGGTSTSIYYKTDKLDSSTIECLRGLGYKVRVRTQPNLWGCVDTEISWEE